MQKREKMTCLKDLLRVIEDQALTCEKLVIVTWRHNVLARGMLAWYQERDCTNEEIYDVGLDAVKGIPTNMYLGCHIVQNNCWWLVLSR